MTSLSDPVSLVSPEAGKKILERGSCVPEESRYNLPIVERSCFRTKASDEFAGVAQLVEHHVANVIVVSSNLIARSVFVNLAGGNASIASVSVVAVPSRHM